MANHVYKILTEAAFSEAMGKGHFLGSADDRRDGFIHLSAADQLEGTLAKHFAKQDGLMLLALDPARLGQQLRWEASRSSPISMLRSTFPLCSGPSRSSSGLTAFTACRKEWRRERAVRSGPGA